MPDLVKVEYQQTGQSTLVNELRVQKKRLRRLFKLYVKMIKRSSWFKEMLTEIVIKDVRVKCW